MLCVQQGVKNLSLTTEISKNDLRESLWVIPRRLFFKRNASSQNLKKKKTKKLFHVYIDHLLLSLSKNATDVKVTADTVKEALEEAEKAQIAAEKAIKLAVEDIQGTQNLLTSVRG